MADIRLEHVCKVYPNGVKAVSDFTMDITDKEFIVFVGPSGCGKSTTLRMIAGLEEISAGNIYIDGVNVNRVEPKDRDVAMVFQNYALYPHMTVYDNMAFALKIRKLPKNVIDEKVRAAAEVLGITDYLNTKPKDMSGGQRQRVALGRAMVREPKVFLLDEPLSNLDAKLRTAMRSEIAKLHRKLQTTFIYVTHDQVEAMTMGTRIVVMKDGFIQQIDTPGNLYNFPCNKFVAGFIGTPQMNFYKATLFLDGETVRVKFVDSDTEFVVPFENFAKADKTFLNGEKPVYVGIRSEHVSIEPDKFPCKAKCRVSYAENLGVESQVYADFNLDSENTLAESPTKVIIKAAAGATFEDDSVIDVSVDFDSVHVFDAETEQSVLPRVPQYSTVKMTVKDNVATILSGKVTLPPALALPDGEYDLQLPTEAVTLGGGWKVPVWRKEDVDGKTLMFLGSARETAFALCDNTNGAGFSIDFSKCVISTGGAPIISAVPTENRLNFTVIKEGKTRKISIGGVPLSSSRVTDAAVDSFGREAYKHVFQLVFTPADVAIGGEIAAKAEAVLDYGSKKYLKCSIGDEAVYVETDDVAEYAVDSQVTLAIDEKKVHVYSPDVDLIIL